MTPATLSLSSSAAPFFLDLSSAPSETSSSSSPVRIERRREKQRMEYDDVVQLSMCYPIVSPVADCCHEHSTVLYH